MGSGSRPDERKLHVGSNPTVGNLINFYKVDLSEWSKEPGLGPGMFACAGSNPAVNIIKLMSLWPNGQGARLRNGRF